MENAEREAVEVGHVVVDPLLPRLIVGAKVRRQPLHGVQEDRKRAVRISGDTARGRPSLCTSA
eukprot:scaffold12020_cov122-Isochrysis_galbana.AAC.12